MKIAVIAIVALFASCAHSPDRELRKRVESQFLSHIGKSITWSPQVEVLDYQTEQPVDLEKVEGVPPGYDRQGFFISYEYDPLCVDWYAVFSSCPEIDCDYWFARTGGICE